MRPKPPPKDLQAIWDQVPSINCQGKCADSCGPIGCSSLERKLMEQRSGRRLRPVGKELTCSMLTPNGRCSVYSIRPLVCRFWGVTKAMPCPHGCEPERWLSDKEAIRLMTEAAQLAGDPEGAAHDMLQSMTPEDLQAFHDYVAEGEENREAFLRNIRRQD